MGAPIELARPLVTADQIQARVQELASQINHDYGDTRRSLSVIVVLKGAAFFAIDLLKLLTMSTQVDFLRASSYRGTESTGEVHLISDITMPISGTDVLLVEDIVDSGLTAAWLARHLAGNRPASVRLCTLLDKPARRLVPVTIDYTGFVIPDEFVLGYGLDYEEGYRNLPHIYVAREKIEPA